MENLLLLLSRYYDGRVTLEDGVLQLNRKPKYQRELINHHFIRRLHKNGFLNIDGYKGIYEFLLDSLLQWDLPKFLIPRITLPKTFK